MLGALLPQLPCLTVVATAASALLPWDGVLCSCYQVPGPVSSLAPSCCCWSCSARSDHSQPEHVRLREHDMLP